MHLDMCVKLLDYFGTIFVSSKNSEVFATFWNFTKIERLTNPIFTQNQSKPTNRWTWWFFLPSPTFFYVLIWHVLDDKKHDVPLTMKEI
jgi:hypothetical protein